MNPYSEVYKLTRLNDEKQGIIERQYQINNELEEKLRIALDKLDTIPDVNIVNEQQQYIAKLQEELNSLNSRPDATMMSGQQEYIRKLEAELAITEKAYNGATEHIIALENELRTKGLTVKTPEPCVNFEFEYYAQLEINRKAKELNALLLKAITLMGGL